LAYTSTFLKVAKSSTFDNTGIHCLIICVIQLLTLTPNNSGGICSPDIRSVSTLEVLRNCVLQIDIYLLTYLLTMFHSLEPANCLSLKVVI